MDWVMIRYINPDKEARTTHPPWLTVGEHMEDTTQQLYFPGRLLGFYSIEGDEICCAVQTCEYKYTNVNKINCVWQLAQTMTLPTAAIVNHCCMIPYNDEETHWIHIWCKESWGNKFFNM